MGSSLDVPTGTPASPVVTPVATVPATPPVLGSPEYDAAVLARVEKAGFTSSEDTPAPARPAWLPEKFKSAEDMAKAYGELEGKLGGAKPPVATPVAPAIDADGLPVVPSTVSAIDMASFEKEFVDTGAVSEASYKSLQDKGLDKATVDQYVQGRMALAAQYEGTAFDVAGNKTEYAKLAGWAANNLQPEAQDVYNKAVRSGDVNTMKFAVEGLKARYDAVMGRPAISPVVPNTTTSTSTGYQTYTQMVTDMKDSRYKTDPDYRRSVEQKAANAAF